MSDQLYSEEEVPDEGLTKIVSYLDGELDETQMNEVEQDLIENPDMRNDADVLSKTWALLDELDEVSADRQFTQDTLATVAADTVEDSSARSTGGFRRFKEALAVHKMIPCFLLGLLGGGIGLWISHRVWNNRQVSGASAAVRIVLEDFELVRNADVYSVVPDLERLKELQLPDGNIGGQNRPTRGEADE